MTHSPDPATPDDAESFRARVARFVAARSDFHAAAAREKERLREAWETLESQQRRTAAEWTEAHAFFAKQDESLTARTAELAAREKALATARAALERETAGLRAEAAALDVRVRNARAAVDELEQKRDRVRAELLGPLAPPEVPPPAELAVALDRAADRDLTRFAAELDARAELLAREKARVAAVAAAVERENAALADRRRVLTEQFVLLADARGRWQEVERQTVAEMEELACGLGERERDLDAREERLVRADARRREDAYDLWQVRLRLEAWQSKLTAAEQQSHADPADGAAAEVATLRNEFERMAAVLIDAGLPDPPDSELPWAAEDADAEADDVLPFPQSRAA